MILDEMIFGRVIDVFGREDFEEHDFGGDDLREGFENSKKIATSSAFPWPSNSHAQIFRVVWHTNIKNDQPSTVLISSPIKAPERNGFGKFPKFPLLAPRRFFR